MVAKVGARWGRYNMFNKFKVIFNEPNVFKVQFLYGMMT